MKFRTEIDIHPIERLLDHRSKIVSVGSCFAAEIGMKMEHLKFDISVNPFGIVYNSDSILQLLTSSINEEQILDEDLIESQGQWHHFQYHGSLYGPSKEDLNNRIATQRSDARRKLLKADVFILTLGTAYVFRRKLNGQIVANCHKVPATEFTREILTLNHVIDNLHQSIKCLRTHKPELEVIITVSPIRHIRDGLIENQQSKAVLLQAVHSIISETSGVQYFPAYEIMIDDLRDYRFYKPDLIHPNEMALEYIWEQWQKFAVHPQSQSLAEKIEKIKKAMDHRFLYDNPERKSLFAKKQLEAIDQVVSVAPNLDFSEEIRYFGALD